MKSNDTKRLFVVSLFLVFLVPSASAKSNCSTRWQRNGGSSASLPDITNPGPDTPSFPTSPFTLPAGRGYFENFPLYVGLPDKRQDVSYNWPWLLRIGLCNNLEFRLISQGATVIGRRGDKPRIAGYSSVNVGFKAHLWGTQEMLFFPSGGIECFLITPFASTQLDMGTQFFISALFAHFFPRDWELEWNLDFFSRRLDGTSNRAVSLDVEWALQKKVLPRLALFFEGSYVTPKRPFYESELLLGVGFQSPLTQRISIYGSYIWSIFKSDQDSITLGFAIAF